MHHLTSLIAGASLGAVCWAADVPLPVTCVLAFALGWVLTPTPSKGEGK